MRHRRLIVVTLAVTALAVAPTLAGAQSVSARPAAITAAHAASVSAVPKFIFHAGLAFGAFHHFIYLPFKAGKFTSGGFLSKLKNYVEPGGGAVRLSRDQARAPGRAAEQAAQARRRTADGGGVAVQHDRLQGQGPQSRSGDDQLGPERRHVDRESGQAERSSVSEAIPSAKQLLTGSA